MAGYIYIPAPTPEMREFAKDWQDGQRRKGKTPYVILQNYDSGWRKGFLRAIGRGVLRNVQAADKLYILAHGAALGSRFIGAERGAVKQGTNWVGGTLKKYSPDRLAQVMKDEGLKTGFQDLRVFACGSALIKANSAMTISFAGGLKNALVALGYANIRVTGYQGSVRSSYSVRQVPGQMGQYTAGEHKGVEIGGQIYPADTHKVVF
jgi:hypothetical protein